MSRPSWDRNWPYMICPACRKNIVEPNWRFKCLFSLRGIPCLHCSAPLKLVGNLWNGYGIGSALLIIGGTLWSKDFSRALCVLFLISGSLVIGWGIFTSRLTIVGEEGKKEELPVRKQH